MKDLKILALLALPVLAAVADNGAQGNLVLSDDRSNGTVVGLDEAWELQVPKGSEQDFWVRFSHEAEKPLEFYVDPMRRRDRDGCVVSVPWQKWRPFVLTNMPIIVVCRQDESRPLGANGPELRLTDSGGDETFRFQPVETKQAGDLLVSTYRIFADAVTGVTWGSNANGRFDPPLQLFEIHFSPVAAGTFSLESIEPVAQGTVRCRETVLAFEPDRDFYSCGWDDNGTVAYEDGVLVARPSLARLHLRERHLLDSMPFRGTESMTLVTEGAPAKGGTVCVYVRERDSERDRTFTAPWTDRTVIMTPGLDPAEFYQCYQVSLTVGAGVAWPKTVKFLSFTGESLQTAAKAIRLVTDTGSDIHVLTNAESRSVMFRLENTSDTEVSVEGSLMLANFFGETWSVPVSARIAAGGQADYPVPLTQLEGKGGRPLRYHGLWIATAELKASEDGSRSFPETRFAVLNPNPVTPRLKPPKFRLGVNYHMGEYAPSPRDLRMTLDALNACGCKLVRAGGWAFDANWTDSRKDGEPDFTEADRKMLLLKERGLSLNCDCWPFPPWASSRPDLPYTERIRNPPTEGLMGAYCEKLARHFGADIDYIETSNEADLWPINTFSAADYVRYQKECYEGVKRGCPSIRVLTSAFACCDSSPPKVSKKGFHETVVREAKGFYDAHPVHMHGAFSEYENDILGKFLPMREREGVTVPWYANETALTSVPGNENAVARAVWQKILFSWAHGSTDYIWYNLRGTGWRPNDPEQGYGLLSRDYFPRAGFAAFSALAHIVTGLDFAGTVMETKNRHFYKFAADGRIVFAGWDASTDPAHKIRIETDATEGRFFDLMGNPVSADRCAGGFVFPISKTPGALVLTGGTHAEANAEDAATVPQPKASIRVVQAEIDGRNPDFVLDRVWNVHQLYAANPETVDRTWGGEQDLSAKIWVGRAGDSLRVRFEVRDDVHRQTFPADQLDLSDGVQFILQSPSQSGNFEFGLARTEAGEGLVNVRAVPTGFSTDEVCVSVRLDTSRTGDITVYDATIPLAAIGFSVATLANGFRFNAIAYDYDGLGEDRESWIEITPGIATDKDYSLSPYVCIGRTALEPAYTGEGADPSNLSRSDNWTPSSWASSGALTLDGGINDLAYRMTAPLPVADRLILTGFADDRTVDFCGCLSGVPNLKFMGNTDGRKITLKGGVDNLTEFRVDIDSGVVLSDGVYHIGTGRLLLYNWNSELWINSDAELAIDKINDLCGAQSGSQSTYAYLCLNGGNLTVKAQADCDKYLQFNGTYSGFEMLNGATLDICDSAPGFLFNASPASGKAQAGRPRIVDSTLLMTNSNNGARGLMIHPHAATFAVTNSTIRFPQFYCGQFTSDNYGGAGTYYSLNYNANDSQFTFNNSIVAAAFRPGSAYAAYSGIFFGPKTRGNTMAFDGERSSYTGAIFALGGETNTLKVMDGTFKATSLFDFVAGHHAHAWFSGGESTLSKVRSRNTNSTFTVSNTARVDVNGDFYCSTDRSGVEVTGGNLSVYTTDSKSTAFRLEGSENYITTAGDGAVTTGKVVFAGSDGRVTVADGGLHVGMRSVGGGNFPSGVTFTSGKSGNVLTISNAVFESAMPFAANCALATAEGPKAEAVPFTGCPGCRIELVGADAKFLVTSNHRYGNSDNPWYSCALGEMIDRSGETPRWTTAAYPLDNPVRVRFCLPPEGWREAPFRVTAGRAVLGGNAEFEFDASCYVWPVKGTRVPLIYNSTAYDGWNHRKYINVAQLNETNAARLPVSPVGFKTSLALGADGKTLELVVPGLDVDVTADDYKGVYDGKGHVVGVRVAKPDGAGEVAITYSRSAEGPFVPLNEFDQVKDVTKDGPVTVYVRVSVQNSASVTASATVTITPRAVTVRAGSGEKGFDREPLVVTDYEATGFAEGEGIAGLEMTRESVMIVPGTKVNAIDETSVAFVDGTDPENYVISYLNGELTVTPGMGVSGIDTFEDEQVGAAAEMLENWRGEEASVVLESYDAPTPPGHVTALATHTRVLDVPADEVVRTVPASLADKDKFEFMACVRRSKAKLVHPEDDIQLQIAVDEQGHLCLWHLYKEDDEWRKGWLPLSETTFGDGEWVRICVEFDYGSNLSGDAFAKVTVNGSCQPTAHGVRSPRDTQAFGPWHYLAKNRHTGGVMPLKEIGFAHTKVDDLMIAKATVPADHEGPTAIDGIDFSWFDNAGLPRNPLAAAPFIPGYTLGDVYTAGLDPYSDRPLDLVDFRVNEHGEVHVEFNGYKGEEPDGYQMLYSSTPDFKSPVVLQSSEGKFDGDAATWTTTWDGKIPNDEMNGGFYRLRAIR